MDNGLLTAARQRADGELLDHLCRLCGRERQVTAEVIAHLAELDRRRRLYLRLGYPSLYVYCREVLLLSEWEAYNRILAARAVRRFPAILDPLERGAINLTTVRLLAPHLTEENHAAVLQEASGLKKTDVERLVARLAPAPDVPTAVQKLPTTTQALSPGRYLLQVTVSETTLEKLRCAKDLLRHTLPDGDDDAILNRALTLLVQHLAKKKFAATRRPRASSPPAPGSRHIPAEVQRAVYVRDLGRCAYVGNNGRRCEERGFIEFHHVVPYACGGPPTVPNVELRCRAHNSHEWDQWMHELRLEEDKRYRARASPPVRDVFRNNWPRAG